MQRTSRFLLLVCGSLTPLFAGCGGCGSPSLAQQQAMRGSWGVEDEEEDERPTPAKPAPIEEEEPASPPPKAVAAETPTAASPAAQTAETQTLEPKTPETQTLEPQAPATETPATSATPVVSSPPATAESPMASITPTSPLSASQASQRPVTTAAAPITNAAAVPAESSVGSGETATPAERRFQVASANEVELPERPVASGDLTATLVPQAKDFAAADKETEADRLLLGEALLRDRLEEWPFAMRWSPALRRPVPWIRTGVAFYVSATDVRGDMAPIPAKDRALERDFGPMGRDVLALGGELAEKSLASHLTLLRAGALGPTLAPLASGPVDAGRPLPTRLCGGLLLFGPGEPRLLKAHAERLGLDLLIVYDVRAKRNVDDPRQPINDTSFKILDVVGDREIFATKLLRNMEVQATRKNPVAPDPVDQVTKEIQQFVDGQLPLADFPAEVRPDNVRARLPKLIDQALASKNALPYLVEIKALHLHGYLAGLEARDAYASILGEREGQALYSGTPEERLVALERLLPRMQGGAKPVDTVSVGD
ncbi:MAG TPA: hypothetical protein VGN57_06520 [Pirellulaceae bacterium]|jgi:hypothetical protein|nr:hypothetical protein [Pirellulaceae bacterium]